VRLKEKGVATEVDRRLLRRAAVPGDAAHRDGDRRRPRHPGASRDDELQPLAVAKLLKALVDKEQPGLVILGKQAIDDDATRPARCWPRWPTCRRPPSHRKVEVADGTRR
jgi:electron transfer flavoprotein beta subunit